MPWNSTEMFKASLCVPHCVLLCSALQMHSVCLCGTGTQWHGVDDFMPQSVDDFMYWIYLQWQLELSHAVYSMPRRRTLAGNSFAWTLVKLAASQLLASATCRWQ